MELKLTLLYRQVIGWKVVTWMIQRKRNWRISISILVLTDQRLTWSVVGIIIFGLSQESRSVVPAGAVDLNRSSEKVFCVFCCDSHRESLEVGRLFCRMI